MIHVIDVFAHILPPQFLQQMLNVVPHVLEGQNSWMHNELLTDLKSRKSTILPNHQEILSVVNLNPEDFMGPQASLQLCYQLNQELIEIVNQNSNFFPAAVAAVPMNNIEGACKLIQEQVKPSKELAGIQLFTRALNQAITVPEYEPLFTLMNQIQKPIWLHPVFDSRKPDNNMTFSWEYELTLAMNQIVAADYFKKYPNLRIIVHHAGAMVPTFSERIRYIQGSDRYEQFRHFYVDTALLGNSLALELTVEFFSSQHVLFGTDTPLGIPPVGPTSQIEEALMQSNLQPAVLQQIFRDNWFKLIQN